MSKLSAILLCGCLTFAAASVYATEDAPRDLQPGAAMDHDSMVMSETEHGTAGIKEEEATQHEGMAAEDTTAGAASHDGMANEEMKKDDMKKDADE